MELQESEHSMDKGGSAALGTQVATPSVTVQCVGCRARREVGPGEVPLGEVPLCGLCLLPMVAVKASA